MGVTCRVGVQNSEAVDFLPYTHWATWRTCLFCWKQQKKAVPGAKGGRKGGTKEWWRFGEALGKKNKPDSQQPGRDADGRPARLSPHTGKGPANGSCVCNECHTA